MEWERTVLDVFVAKHSGFCFGVEKAIERSRMELMNIQPDDQPVYSLGPLIHNRQVVNELESQGLKTLEDLDHASAGTVIIRSHGVAEWVYGEIENKGMKVVDATCPFVRKTQEIVRDQHKAGSRIVIVGDKNHPEVIGINGWCDNKGIVLEDPRQLHGISSTTPITIVAQTTVQEALFEKVTALIRSKFTNVQVCNTICLATRQRQEAAKKLAEMVDAMIIIGGRHSSNTQKLFEVCRSVLPDDTWLVENVYELPFGKICHYNRVGVTAGASTPDDLIKQVVDLLQAIDHQKKWQIAIDGPAGAGKSTIARKLADQFSFTYVDTGAMYRAVTLSVIRNGIPLTNTMEILELLESVEISFANDRIFLDGMDVTDEIRTKEVTAGVSAIAGIKEIRKKLVELQQKIAESNHVVMDGRDIGTVVLAGADVKVFLTATAEERAQRRFAETKHENGESYKMILQQIKERDFADETREHDPLVPAEDAVQIDTTHLSIQEVVEKITILFIDTVKAKVNK